MRSRHAHAALIAIRAAAMMALTALTGCATTDCVGPVGNPGLTPAQVAAEVRAHLDCFTPGSGFVLASVHNIQAHVPPENIIALFDTALAYASQA